MAVRILFQRGGHCAVSLLASRRAGLPEQLTVSSGAGEVELSELQENWYEAEVVGSLGDLLHTGFVWTDRETDQEWVLSGRKVFVLASGTEHRGFVSCPRLAVGREHLVLCAAAQLAAVEEGLRRAGCSGWTQLGEDDGVPGGWRLLTAVRPQGPVPLSNDNHILNVLRPLPDIEISLEGGIRLTSNQWLLGYPPEIRIYGDPAHTGEVLIDGEEAVRLEQGGYKIPGWDTEGEHRVWCGNTSKSYSLTRGKSSWEFWRAHSFSLPGTKRKGEALALCGSVVWSSTSESLPDQRRRFRFHRAIPFSLAPVRVRCTSHTDDRMSVGRRVSGRLRSIRCGRSPLDRCKVTSEGSEYYWLENPCPPATMPVAAASRRVTATWSVGIR